MDPIDPDKYAETEWVDFAACRDDDGVTAYAMFPDERDDGAVAYAKSICDVCPVVTECLRAAFERNERYGVWGGLTYEERHALKRREARQAKPVIPAQRAA